MSSLIYIHLRNKPHYILGRPKVVRVSSGQKPIAIYDHRHINSFMHLFVCTSSLY